MWKTKTLRGLDEALIELKNAIDVLEDDSIKRQLVKRFQRILEVREELSEKPKMRHNLILPILFATLFIVLVFIAFFLKTRNFKL